jgi:hypothetical protein
MSGQACAGKQFSLRRMISVNIDFEEEYEFSYLCV